MTIKLDKFQDYAINVTERILLIKVIFQSYTHLSFDGFT